MDQSNPNDAPPGWLEALAESEADVAAGRIVDSAEVLKMLAESIDRMAARKTTSRG